jgi:glutathione S-transferase
MNPSEKRMKLYHNPMSRSATVHWMLEEVNADCEIILLDFKKKEHKTPEFLALNPMGKLPTLVHQGVVITESAAICTYLADIFPEKKLAPVLGDPMRGTYLRWMFFSASCLEPAILDHMLNRATGEKSSMGYGSYEDTLQVLETQLTRGPFLLGDTFSAADVYLSSQLSWGLMTKALDTRAAFVQYVARCSERPAFKKYSAASKEMIAKLL